MDRIIPQSSPGRYKAAGLLALVFAMFGAFFAFTPAASAHHPEITGETSCHDGGGYTVDFTSISWQPSGGNSGGGANPHIDIYYRLSGGDWTKLPWQTSYKYTSQNGYQFTDNFVVTPSAGQQIQLRAYAAAKWGNGNDGGQATDTDWIGFPTDCSTPGVPLVSAAVQCANGNGDITVTLANTGDANAKPVHFVVTDPRDGTTTEKDVAHGESTTVTLTGFPDGSVTIPITADGASQDKTLKVDCDRPGVPEVSAAVACSNGNGDITVTLKNTAGDLPVTFVVTDPRTNATTTKTLAVGQTDTVVLTGFADGAVTIPVTVGATHYDQTLTVKCDRPGQPEIKTSVVCSNGNGDVTVTLTNKGGDLPVTFVVTDPNTNVQTTKTLNPGQTDTVVLPGFEDGDHTIPVTVDGVATDQKVSVHCDIPGVPSVSAGVVCANGNGDITVTLANTGGNQPILFVVTDPRGGAPVSKTVQPGGNDSVVLTGFADGPVTIGVTADGVAMNQTLTVDCDIPGTPSVKVTQECVDFDGTVVVTLGNTAGNQPILYTVTNPVTNEVKTVTVAPGASMTVTFTGIPDGTHTIPVTADGTHHDQTITVDCDRPGTPAVFQDVSCAALGGKVVVTVSNASAAGTAEPIVFTVSDPRPGSDAAPQTITVPAGDSVKVTFDNLDDGPYTLSVTADGTPLPNVHFDVDCRKPEASITVSCAEGGALVELKNTGGSDVELTVKKNGTDVKTTIVPGNGTKTVLVPMNEDETATITVHDGSTVVKSSTVTRNCEEPTTTTTTAPTTTTTEPEPPTTTTTAPTTTTTQPTTTTTEPPTTTTTAPPTTTTTQPSTTTTTQATTTTTEPPTTTTTEAPTTTTTRPTTTTTNPCEEPSTTTTSTPGNTSTTMPHNCGTTTTTTTPQETTTTTTPCGETTTTTAPGQTTTTAPGETTTTMPNNCGTTTTTTTPCEETTTTTAPGETTTTAAGETTTTMPTGCTTTTVPVQVLPDDETKVLGDTVTRGTLPVTGGSPLGLMVFAVSLLVAGFCIRQASRAAGR